MACSAKSVDDDKQASGSTVPEALTQSSDWQGKSRSINLHLAARPNMHVSLFIAWALAEMHRDHRQVSPQVIEMRRSKYIALPEGCLLPTLLVAMIDRQK